MRPLATSVNTAPARARLRLRLRARQTASSRDLQRGNSLAASGVPHPPGDSQTGFGSEGNQILYLAVTNLEDRPSAGPEQTRQIVKQPTDQIESVATAIESSPRIVTDFCRQMGEICGRYVGEVGHYEIPRRCNSGCEMTDVRSNGDPVAYDVAPRHLKSRD